MSPLRKALKSLPAPVKRTLQERLYPALLPEGETAPEWHLQAQDGTWHRQGRHWSVMVFYPQDGGDEDKNQLAEFQSHVKDFERLGVKIFGVNAAEAESHDTFAKESGLTFPLLTDRGGSVARQFKSCVQLPGSPMYIRTVYLVNPERKIRLGNRGMPSVAAIIRSIEALQSASKTGM
jgi:peroxiredoxin